MKRIFTSTLILALSIGAASAQTTKEAQKEGVKKEHRGQFEKMNLTEAQKAKMAELRAKHKAERESEKTNRKELMQRHRAEMEAILTPEQKAEMQKKRAERSAAFEKGKGFNKEGRKGGKQGQMARKGNFERRGDVAKQLALTTDQQAKMKAAQTDFRAQMQSLRADSKLSAEQKAAKRKELAQQHQAQVKNILTKEQQEKMQQMRKDRPRNSAK